MRRADRLFEIIQILRRSRGPISAESIGRELEVSKRTVYRDIAALMGQRVPIVGEAGMGYVLDHGFDMPPLMLTEDEVDAAVLGAHWVLSRGEPVLSSAAQSLLTKLTTVVPERLRSAILEPLTSVAPVSPPAEAVSAEDLRAALRSRRKLRISYVDGKGCASERVVWPVLLGYRDKGRILAAWCELRQSFRYFRTDRLLVADVLLDPIPERPKVLRAQWEAAMAIERLRYFSADKDRS